MGRKFKKVIGSLLDLHLPTQLAAVSDGVHKCPSKSIFKFSLFDFSQNAQIWDAKEKGVVKLLKRTQNFYSFVEEFLLEFFGIFHLLTIIFLFLMRIAIDNFWNGRKFRSGLKGYFL